MVDGMVAGFPNVVPASDTIERGFGHLSIYRCSRPPTYTDAIPDRLFHHAKRLNPDREFLRSKLCSGLEEQEQRRL
jgi:hypothetical protein